mgnify:CR=1 FL=1
MTYNHDVHIKEGQGRQTFRQAMTAYLYQNDIRELEERFAQVVTRKIKSIVVKDVKVGEVLPDGSQRNASDTFMITARAPHAFKQGEYIETFSDKMDTLRLCAVIDAQLKEYGITIAGHRCEVYHETSSLLKSCHDRNKISKADIIATCFAELFTCCLYSTAKERSGLKQCKQARLESYDALYYVLVQMVVSDPSAAVVADRL